MYLHHLYSIWLKVGSPMLVIEIQLRSLEKPPVSPRLWSYCASWTTYPKSPMAAKTSKISCISANPSPKATVAVQAQSLPLTVQLYGAKRLATQPHVHRLNALLPRPALGTRRRLSHDDSSTFDASRVRICSCSDTLPAFMILGCARGGLVLATVP